MSELLFEFSVERTHARWRCDLYDHGERGIEAQFLKNEQFFMSRLLKDKAEAVQWAHIERIFIENGERKY